MALLSSWPLRLAEGNTPFIGHEAHIPALKRINSSTWGEPECRRATPALALPEPAFRSKRAGLWRAMASNLEVANAGDWGEPISLGTVKLPANVDLPKLETLLYQWGSNLTQNANVPFPAPLKIDRIDGGVRIGYIRVTDGVVEDLVHIDCCVFPATTNAGAIFRAVRNGQLKNQTPPGEAAIMQSLLQALKKSIELCKV